MATENVSSVAGGIHTLSRRWPWQAPGDQTITSRYSTTSLRLLHDPHFAILIGLSSDLCLLLIVMEAGCGASAPGVQEAPQRRRVWFLRGVAVSGRNLGHKIH